MSKPDATPAGGVSTETPAVTPETPASSIQAYVPEPAEITLPERREPGHDETPDPRDAIEEAAAARLKALRAKEGGEQVTPAPVETQPEQQPQPAAQQPQPEAQPERQMVRVKVDGVEREVPLDDVLKNYQIGASASNDKEQAVRARRDADAKLAEADRILIEARGRQTPAEQPKPAAPAKPDVGQLVKDMANAYDFGTTEDREKATLAVLEAVAQPAGVKAEDVQGMVQQQIGDYVERQRTNDGLAKLYSPENREIMSDRLLGAAVAAATHDQMVDDLIKLGADANKAAQLSADEVGSFHHLARKAGKARSFEEITGESVKRVKERFKIGSPAPQAQPKPDPLATRKDAKRETVPPPAPATHRPSAQPATRKSASQVIAEDRAAR